MNECRENVGVELHEIFWKDNGVLYRGELYCDNDFPRDGLAKMLLSVVEHVIGKEDYIDFIEAEIYGR